ncbi:hypothetical protein [Bacilliculturomica massiliensis]|uniref:hypothetical protein n=1 Tax=Bacilliculturomica massiliensis TaxID=1917867 RepID=UPI0013EF52C9
MFHLHKPCGTSSFLLSFQIKENNIKIGYEHVMGNQHDFTYSQQFIDFIIDEIRA